MPLTAEHGLLALAIGSSTNEKIGDCATTYAAQTSCPSSCAFYKGGGCYAENGTIYSGLTKPLNDAAENLDATFMQVAVEEAGALVARTGARGRPLRLHTVGDCKTDEAAQLLAAASKRYIERGGGPVWAYTHAWRTVDRASWGCVSVLASCESPEQVELARARGYATALVVPSFEQRSLHDCRTASVSRNARGDTGSPGRTGDGPTAGEVGAPVTSALILPCPAQTTDRVTCSSCRLCMNDAGLRERGYSIGFAVHGTAFTVKKAVESLDRPSDPSRRLTSRDHALAFLDQHGRLPRPSELQRLAAVTAGSAKEMVDKLRAELRTAA